MSDENPVPVSPPVVSPPPSPVLLDPVVVEAPKGPTVEERLDAMEAALAGVIGHVVEGVRTASPVVKADAKSAYTHTKEWFEGVREKYFPGTKIKTPEETKGEALLKAETP